MSDFLSIALETETDPESKDKVCNRSLIVSILYQAMIDAACPKRPTAFKSARKFINPNNKMFRYYCGLLDYNPEWLSRKIWGYITKQMDLEKIDGRKNNTFSKRFERNKEPDLTS